MLRHLDWGLTIITVFLAGLTAFVVFGLVAAAFSIHLEAECLSLGYRNANLTYKLKQYCVTRLQQTDLVLPIEVARKYPLVPQGGVSY